MRHASSLLEVLGCALIGAASFFVDWRVLVAYIGVVCIVAALVLDPPRRGSE